MLKLIKKVIQTQKQFFNITSVYQNKSKTL